MSVSVFCFIYKHGIIMFEIIQVYLDLMPTANKGFVVTVILPPFCRLIHHLIYVLCSLAARPLLYCIGRVELKHSH